MSYHFVNIIDKFEELKISHNNDHYISLIILYIDEYGHYHFLRHKNSNIYSYYPSDIYDKDFKFKKSIKGHILENFNIDDIKKVSHHENDGINQYDSFYVYVWHMDVDPNGYAWIRFYYGGGDDDFDEFRHKGNGSRSFYLKTKVLGVLGWEQVSIIPKNLIL